MGSNILKISDIYPDNKIKIYMGDFRKNAGIVGLVFLLKTVEAKENKDYGISDEYLWLDYEYAVNRDWTDDYFKACTLYFEEDVSYGEVISSIDFLLEYIANDKKTENKTETIKQQLDFINKKIFASSIKSGMESIQDETDISVYKDFEKNKLNIKTENKVLLDSLALLKEFLTQSSVKKTFIMKNVIYRYTNKVWEGISFLNRQNAKKNMGQIFEKDFALPLTKFWTSEQKKSDNFCIDCGKHIDSNNRVAISFMADTADDLKRKSSSFWNFKPDSYLCPECAFIYALAPMGFNVMNDKLIFINTSNSIESLIKSNGKTNAMKTKSKQEKEERKNPWQARVMNLILQENYKRGLNNIQVITKSISENGKYSFIIINKEILKIFENSTVQKKMKLLAEKPVYKINNEFLNIYNIALDNIFNYRKQYYLVNYLIRNSLNTESSILNYPASLIFDIENCRYAATQKLKLKDKGVEEMSKYMKYMALKGQELRKALEQNITGNFDDSMRGTIYQLLNALSVKNSRRFLDIVIRLYCSCQISIPNGFTEMLESSEEFEVRGYAFLLGLKSDNKIVKKEEIKEA